MTNENLQILPLEAYSHQAADRWRWRQSTGADTQDIVDLALVCFGGETDQFFQNDPLEYGKNVMLATVNQFYNPVSELLSVAHDGPVLLAYTWVIRGQYAPWSKEEMATVRIAHVRQDLSQRERITLLAQMLQMWEVWARAAKINIIFSSTIRESQDPFMRLHERAGYTVRGSCAYKRLSNIKIDLVSGKIDVLK
jgi:hypothetical protein